MTLRQPPIRSPAEITIRATRLPPVGR